MEIMHDLNNTDFHHQGWLGYGFTFPTYNASAKTTTMNLQNASSNSIMIFYTVLLLTKELTLQPEKCDSGHSMESTGFIMFPTILKHLAW